MVKVSLVRCLDYDRDNVSAAVKRSVDLIGGIERFVKPGAKVLLKPNLLSARPPEEAVDTHPEVVRAVVRLVKAAGGHPFVGDSPGGYGKNFEEVFQVSGMRALAEEEGIELVEFKRSKVVDEMPISRHIFDSDLVISLPKLKTHCITILTAAIKNMFGAITGLHKAECHSKAPRDEDFARLIAKIYGAARPHLSIVDGIVGMEGDGPSAGVPRKMELVMAGEDGVAIDACFAKIVGLEPLDVNVTKAAYQMGLGEADLAKIEIVGDGIDTFMVNDFKMPPTTLLKILPRGLVNSLAAQVRFKPYINDDICARCNLCKISCPVNCIEIEKNYCRIDYDKCIRCLCCHEVCPYKAISVKRNMLTKLVWG